MDKENEVEELKQRIADLESKVNNNHRRSNAWRFSITFIIVIVALLISIGIFQFVSAP